MGRPNPGSSGSGLAADPGSTARGRGQECGMDWSGIGGSRGGLPRRSRSRGFRERRRGKDDDDFSFDYGECNFLLRIKQTWKNKG
jgi:hypothetical protein